MLHVWMGSLTKAISASVHRGTQESIVMKVSQQTNKQTNKQIPQNYMNNSRSNLINQVSECKHKQGSGWDDPFYKVKKVNTLEKLFESFFCFFSLVYSQTSTSAIQGPTTVMLMLHVITLLVPLTAPVSTDLAETAKSALVTMQLLDFLHLPCDLSFRYIDLWVIKIKSLWSFAHVVYRDQVNWARNADHAETGCEGFVYSTVKIARFYDHWAWQTHSFFRIDELRKGLWVFVFFIVLVRMLIGWAGKFWSHGMLISSLQTVYRLCSQHIVLLPQLDIFINKEHKQALKGRETLQLRVTWTEEEKN